MPSPSPIRHPALPPSPPTGSHIVALIVVADRAHDCARVDLAVLVVGRLRNDPVASVVLLALADALADGDVRTFDGLSGALQLIGQADLLTAVLGIQDYTG